METWVPKNNSGYRVRYVHDYNIELIAIDLFVAYY